nr:murD [Sinorhizobium meliloti]
MIPVTSHSRQKSHSSARRSGLATAQALVSGGADVVAWDDNPDSVAKAAAAGIATADLRGADWHAFAAFVLSPGVPLTHPKPHWSVDLAHQAGVEIIGDVELFVRERRKHAPDCPFIAITGTNGKSTTTALVAHILRTSGRGRAARRQYRHRGADAGPAEAGRFYVVECSSYQIDLAPTLDPDRRILLNLRRSPGSPRHDAALCEHKERLVAGSGTAVVGVDDSLSSLIADRVERAGTKVVSISRRHPLAEGSMPKARR